MKFNKTAEVWYITPGDALAYRTSKIILDSADPITDIDDAERALTVDSGLRRGDLFVALTPHGRFQVADFVVSGFSDPHDGSGTLIHADILNQDPKDLWSNAYIEETWAKLEHLNPGACEQFGLNGLYSHIQSITHSRQLMNDAGVFY